MFHKKTKYLIALAVIVCSIFIQVSGLYPNRIVKADSPACAASNSLPDCTPGIAVTENLNVTLYNSTTNADVPSTSITAADVPSTDVLLLELISGNNKTVLETVVTTVPTIQSGSSVATYYASFASVGLTTNQSNEFAGTGTVAIYSTITNKTTDISSVNYDGPAGSTTIPAATATITQNYSSNLADANINAPGCYTIPPPSFVGVPCSTNGVDINGNAIDPTTYCYTATEGPYLNNIPLYNQVSCTNLTVVYNSAEIVSEKAVAAAANPSTTASCDSSGFSLSWIMCPLIDGMAKAVDGIYGHLIEPLLATPPIAISQPAGCLSTPPTTTVGCDPSNTYKIWSEFRTYGNIFLVLALLGLVFGEIIGGGIIQAYTAKKMLPRILLAVILINLSIYVIAALLDITNVIGSGLSSLISAPFTAAGAFHITLNGTTSGIGLTTFVGAGVLSIWALTLAPELIIMFLLFLLLPALLAMLAVLFTVVIRQGLIIFLVISSPVAFALYVLPNTEQYFKKWWHLLFTTLLVYPIIAVIFAMANALSVTLSNTATTQNGGLTTVSQLVAMVAIIMPLFLIPFAFKIAGGVMGSIYGGLSSLGKKAASGIQGDPRNENSLQNKLRRAGQNIGTRRGNRLKGYLRDKTKDGDNAFKNTWPGKFKRGLANQAINRLPNYDRRQAGINRREAELVQADVANGADGWLRAGFAQEALKDEDYLGANGQTFTKKKGHFYNQAKDSDGKLSEFSRGDVMKAKGWMKGNAGRFQTALTYDISKVGNDGELLGVDENGETIFDVSRINEIDPTKSPGGSLLGNALRVAEEAKIPSGAAQGAFQGAFYSSQAQYRQLKAAKMNPDFSGFKFDGDAFVQDYGNNVGLYTSSNSKPALTYTLLDQYKKLEQKRQNGEVLSDVEKRSYKTLQQTARSFNERLRVENQGRGTASTTAADVVSVSEDGTPQAGSGAAVNVGEAMRRVVEFHQENKLGDVNIDEYVPKPKPDNPEPPAPPPPIPSGPSGGPSRPSSGGSSTDSSGEMIIDHGSVAPSPTIQERAPNASPDSTRPSSPVTQESGRQSRVTPRLRRRSTTRSAANSREVQPQVIVPGPSLTPVSSSPTTQPQAGISPTVTPPETQSRSNNPVQPEVITPSSSPDSQQESEGNSGDRTLNVSVTRSSVNKEEPRVIPPNTTPDIPAPIYISATPPSTASVPSISSSQYSFPPQPPPTASVPLTGVAPTPDDPRWSPDIMDIDSAGRPHNEKGEFISYKDADSAEGKAETIREDLPERENNLPAPPANEQDEDN